MKEFQNRSRTSSLNRVLNARTLIRLKKEAITLLGDARSRDFQPRPGSGCSGFLGLIPKEVYLKPLKISED